MASTDALKWAVSPAALVRAVQTFMEMGNPASGLAGIYAVSTRPGYVGLSPRSDIICGPLLHSLMSADAGSLAQELTPLGYNVAHSTQSSPAGVANLCGAQLLSPVLHITRA